MSATPTPTAPTNAAAVTAAPTSAEPVTIAPTGWAADESGGAGPMNAAPMRADLLALTPDKLAALTNRGLVKRATREIEAAAPTITSDADGTVRAAFAGGLVASLPTGGLEQGTCSCDAPGVCRHLIALVLTYQQHADGPSDGPPELVRWSPGEFTDDQLTERIGARLMAAARRAERTGYVARVHRPSETDPTPHVELSSATVRFLVAGDLGFVHSDATAGTRDEVIALAVWAFRAADAQAPDAPDVRVEVGGSAGAETDGSEMAPALALADAVLADGAVHVGAGLAADIVDVRRRLDAAGLRWPLLAVVDLADQLTAYRDRSARYRPQDVAALIAELHARHRAVANRGVSLRSRVLGTEEAAETPLRRARLDTLGARVRLVGDERVAEVFYAHADSATVLVLRRAWLAEETDADGLARRRIGGSTLGALAGGNLITESAVRSASRAIRLGTGRVAKTTVSPSLGAWEQLPATLVVRDFTALAAALDALPPRPLRPRVEAELVRAVRIDAVRAVSYSPGQQRLDALVTDEEGTLATISAPHSAAAPGRLDAIADVLDGKHGTVRFVAGTVHRGGGGIVVDPLAFAADGPIVVPDLAPAAGTQTPTGTGGAPPDPIAEALNEALGLLAEVAHRGLRHLPPTVSDRITASAQHLATVGLHRVAAAVEHFGATLATDSAVEAWVDAHLRTAVAADLR